MSSAMNDWLYDQVIPQLPKKWMSHYVGKAAHLNLPSAVRKRMIKKFARLYKIDLSEIEKPIEDYSSLGEFFSRRLKPNARPIESDLVAPCDGLLIESGKVHSELLIQAKGKLYSLDDFLPDNPWSSDFKQGSFFTFYLAPHNYHRVHSPVKGHIKWSTVVPGELWPVNKWSVKNIKNLYAQNERVISGIETEKGRVILVMVGATNVGSMSFTFDPNIRTNLVKKTEVVHRSYNDGREVEVGEEFGTFHLGSTVVCLFDENWGLCHQKRRKVKMGQKLIKQLSTK